MTDEIVVMAAVVMVFLLEPHVIEPFVLLQRRRQHSRSHAPQPEEIWVQDDGILYVAGVSAQGVELLSYDAEGRKLYQWRHSWQEWNHRRRVKACYFSGQRKSLSKT
jgi:hypothetical protein